MIAHVAGVPVEEIVPALAGTISGPLPTCSSSGTPPEGSDQAASPYSSWRFHHW